MATSVRLLREAEYVKARVWIPLVLLAGAGAVVWRLEVAKSRPPEIRFAHLTRETIVSSVPTDGKIEPLEWAVARAERQGAVKQILIKNGDHVSPDQELVRLDTSELEAERQTAQSNIEQIRIELQVIEAGGSASERVKIQGDLERTLLNLNQAREEYQKYQRMQSKEIATAAEVLARKQKVDELTLQIKDLNNQKAALVTPGDRASAEARLKNAEAALHLAEQRIAQSVVRSPIDGSVYQFDLKQGAYLNAGDAVASIGRLDRVKVTVYVDERDLGRVKRGMPVRITWDAVPGRDWKGVVDKLAGQVVARGSRQVGEVECVIENPGRELVPGSNVNVEIRAESVDGALTIPKEALRNENGQEGVYLLSGGVIRWRTIKLGVENTTHAQVVEGLADGDSVALITDKTLTDGMPVTAVFP
jgi:HlyD family secretion protein